MKHWQLSEAKFLAPKEVKTLRSHLSKMAKDGSPRNVRMWIFIDLALGSGLRCSELKDLTIDDCLIGDGQASVYVREGKGFKDRVVIISTKLKKHMIKYLKSRGNPTEGTFLVSERGTAYSVRGIQCVAKRCFASIDLPARYSIHSLRHTFCTMLYRATKDLRLVQKQAGHSSPAVTQIYADLLNEELGRGMENLYK